MPIKQRFVELICGLVVAATAVALPAVAAAPKPHYVADAQAVVHALAAGDFQTPEGRFTIQMQQALPPAKLQAVWRQVTKQAGVFEKTAETTSISYKGHAIVLVKTIFKKTPLWTQVVYDGDGKIAGLYFKPVK